MPYWMLPTSQPGKRMGSSASVECHDVPSARWLVTIAAIGINWQKSERKENRAGRVVVVGEG